MKKERIIFNTEIEFALRILAIVNNLKERRVSFDKINYLNYIVMHTEDFDEERNSIHPQSPYRLGKIYAKRKVIKKALLLLSSKGLIEIEYSNEGILYGSSNLTSGLLRFFDSNYYKKFDKRAKWVIEEFGEYEDLYVREIIETKQREIGITLNTRLTLKE